MVKIEVKDSGDYYTCDFFGEETCPGELLGALDSILEYFEKEEDLGPFQVFELYLKFKEKNMKINTKKERRENGRTNN